MSLTTVITHATGDVLPASDWNTYLRDNLNWLIQGGANLASATTLTPTNEFHIVTGTTTIDSLTPTSPVAGQQVRLLFQSQCQIRHNGGGTGNIRFGDATSRYTQPNQLVTFIYDGTNWNGVTPNYRIPITATTAATNTLTETDLLALASSLAGYTIPQNGMLRLTAFGDHVQNSTASRAMERFRLKFGGTTLIDTGAGVGTPMSNNATRFGWKLVAEIMNLAATGTQWVTFKMELVCAITGSFTIVPFVGEGTGYTDGAGSVMNWLISNTAAVDTTAADSLQFTVALPTPNATIEVKLKGGFVEILS